MGALIQPMHAVVARKRGVVVPPGPGPISFDDSFDRANADPMSNPAAGGTWTSGPGGFGPCKIASNELEGSTPGSYNAARVLTPVFDPDQTATIEMPAVVPSFVGCCVRMVDAASASCYVLMTASPANLRLYKVTESGSPLAGGNFVQLGADIPVTPMAWGDEMALEAVGSTLNVYVNGELKATRTDATWAAGQPGVFVYATGATVAAFGSTGTGMPVSGPAAIGDMAIGTTFTIA